MKITIQGATGERLVEAAEKRLARPADLARALVDFGLRVLELRPTMDFQELAGLLDIADGLADPAERREKSREAAASLRRALHDAAVLGGVLERALEAEVAAARMARARRLRAVTPCR